MIWRKERGRVRCGGAGIGGEDHHCKPASEPGINQSTEDWYSGPVAEAGEIEVSAIHVCQCHVDRFRTGGRLARVGHGQVMLR
jgi:hypothetical protein